MIENHIIYSFDDGSRATRFLNYLKTGEVSDVKAGLCRGGKAVKVRYTITQEQVRGFNPTCQQLDDVAARFGGREVD